MLRFATYKHLCRLNKVNEQATTKVFQKVWVDTTWFEIMLDTKSCFRKFFKIVKNPILVGNFSNLLNCIKYMCIRKIVEMENAHAVKYYDYKSRTRSNNNWFYIVLKMSQYHSTKQPSNAKNNNYKYKYFFNKIKSLLKEHKMVTNVQERHYYHHCHYH